MRLTICALLAACADEPTEIRAQRTKPLVCTTVAPIAFYVEQLAGDAVDCEAILPQGEHPQRWLPGRSALGRLASADLVLFHGATLESWTRKVALPLSKQEDVSESLHAQFLKIPNALTHTHGGGSHTQEATNPFLWLDLSLASEQAAIVRDLLVKRGHDREQLTSRLKALQAALRTELASWRAMDLPKGALCSAERSYDYWAKSLGLELVYFALNEASDADAIRIVDKALATKRPRVILCSEEPSARFAQHVSKLRLTPCVFDPCFASKDEDFLQRMAANRARLARALDASASRDGREAREK